LCLKVVLGNLTWTASFGSNSGNDRYTAPRAIAEVKNIRTRSIKAVLVRSSDDPTVAEVSGISSLIVLGSSPDFAIASFDEFCPFSLCLFNSETELAWLCSQNYRNLELCMKSIILQSVTQGHRYKEGIYKY
jgi:hypothetical protein